MAIGLVQYSRSRRTLPPHLAAVPDPLPRRSYARTIGVVVAGLAVVVLAFATGIVTIDNLATWVVVLSAAAAVAIFAVILTSSKVSADERSRVWAFVPLFLGSAVFFALFQRQFTVVTLYSDTRLDRLVGGWEVPIPWVLAFNPLFIVLLAPVFAALWTKLGRRQPMTPVKFGLGIALMGSAFLLFLPWVGVSSVPVLWIALVLLVATMGELLVSPVGLSLSTKLAPAAFPVMMVSLYNLAIALGTALSGWLARFYDPNAEGAYFGTLGAITIGTGLVMLLIARPVHRAMRGID